MESRNQYLIVKRKLLHEERNLFGPFHQNDQLVSHGPCDVSDGGQLHLPNFILRDVSVEFIAVVSMPRLSFGFDQ